MTEIKDVFGRTISLGDIVVYSAQKYGIEGIGRVERFERGKVVVVWTARRPGTWNTGRVGKLSKPIAGHNLLCCGWNVTELYNPNG